MITITIDTRQAEIILQGLKRKQAEINRRYSGSVSQKSDLEDIAELIEKLEGRYEKG